MHSKVSSLLGEAHSAPLYSLFETKQVRVAYKLNVNSFRGNESLQLMIELIED
jgi:hypothetical protein